MVVVLALLSMGIFSFILVRDRDPSQNLLPTGTVDLTASAPQTLHVVGAAGQKVDYRITGESVEGLYRTSGLTIRLRSSSGTVVAEWVTPPVTTTWGSSIIDGDTQTFTIKGQLVVPDVTGTITGAMEGSIAFPQRSGAYFRNVSRSIDVPVVLTTVAAGRYGPQTSFAASDQGILLGMLATVVGMTAAALTGVENRRVGRAAYGLGMVALVVSLGAVILFVISSFS